MIFPIQRFVSVVLEPHSLIEGVGRFPHHNLSPIGSLEENLFEFFTFYMWL
jgi:hypothetical protein